MTRGVCAALCVAMVGCGSAPDPVGDVDGEPYEGPILVQPQGKAGASCPHTTDQFAFSLAGYGGEGHLLACGAETGRVTFNAVVTGADTATVELGTCPAGVGCRNPMTLTVLSPDLAVPLVVGAFVQVNAEVFHTGEGRCAQTLMIRNLPSLGGLPNPITSSPILWLAGADGTLATSPDAPFHVGDAEGCGADSKPGFADDALSFSFAEAALAAPATFSLPMGASYVAQVPGADGTAMDVLLLRNLRSFHSAGAALDDTRDFAYWITHVSEELP